MAVDWLDDSAVRAVMKSIANSVSDNAPTNNSGVNRLSQLRLQCAFKNRGEG